MRDAAINFRAFLDQRDLIDHAASLLSKSRSDFILEASCAAAQVVILDQVYFRLDADKFHEFTALLDTPASPNLGRERLLAVRPLWASLLWSRISLDGCSANARLPLAR
jgi:uncharacterized protein (DUF1778 family)